ncbi:MAG TPA: dihydropteroate synthase [Polyangia bacterium]
MLNCTPDSFADGGRFSDVAGAVAAGLAMAAEGADWIDVGGESTRPGARPVPVDEELGRVIPVIEALAARLEPTVGISIDTYKAETARTAMAAGARIVNDVSGGRLDPSIFAAVAGTNATIVLGHLRGEPATMMENVVFTDVVAEVAGELGEQLAAARAAGCTKLWADPGIGFGKRAEHNLALLADLAALGEAVGVPLMVGVSRKAFIGQLTGKPVGARQFGTAAAVSACVLAGAGAVRVHDVSAMRDVVAVAEAIRASKAR